MTLRAREAWWRRRVQLRRRQERDAKGHDAKQRARVERRKAEAALAKVRQEIAGSTAPTIVTAETIGLGFTYPFGLKGPIYRGAGHYTAGHRAPGRSALVAEMRSDHRFHASKGWGGLSYEAMIADDGTIGLGSPINRKSAAVALNNTGMINVCCPGTTGDRMTAAQVRSVKWLLANWHTVKIPKAHRAPKRVQPGDITWRGHREWPSQSTACPGDMLGQYHEIFRG